MPVTITLDDDLAEHLAEQAKARRVSLQQWATQVLSRVREFPDQNDAWHELNVRRFRLIHQRYHGGLTPAEESELADLNAVADGWLEPIDRQRLEVLESYEELAQGLPREPERPGDE